jgi:hypothetical protein
MKALTQIFQKEASSKILEEMFVALDQQLVFYDFASSLSQKPITSQLINEVIESGIMSSSPEEFITKLKDREISS